MTSAQSHSNRPDAYQEVLRGFQLPHPDIDGEPFRAWGISISFENEPWISHPLTPEGVLRRSFDQPFVSYPWQGVGKPVLILPAAIGFYLGHSEPEVFNALDVELTSWLPDAPRFEVKLEPLKKHLGFYRRGIITADELVTKFPDLFQLSDDEIRRNVKGKRIFCSSEALNREFAGPIFIGDSNRGRRGASPVAPIFGKSPRITPHGEAVFDFGANGEILGENATAYAVGSAIGLSVREIDRNIVNLCELVSRFPASHRWATKGINLAVIAEAALLLRSADRPVRLKELPQTEDLLLPTGATTTISVGF